MRVLLARDLPAIARLRTVLRFDQPECQLAPFGPWHAGAAALFAWRGPRPRLFVARRNGRVVGYAHWQPRLPDQRWLLIALGARAGDPDAAHIWEELLRYSILDAGQRGVKRLYVRLPHGSPAADAIRALGCAPYASETVLLAHDPAPGEAHVAMRPQEQADTWAIHQLYNAAVPRQVQYAEAYTSHVWDVRRPRGHGSPAAVTGWLIEDGHHVIGYARRMARGRTDIIDFVVHPDRLDVLPGLVDGTLARLAPRAGRRVYCAVRGYQQEVATALLDRGFSLVLEQDLHVRYTTVSARAATLEAVPVHLEVKDKLPQRVPSFLHGQPRDESAI